MIKKQTVYVPVSPLDTELLKYKANKMKVDKEIWQMIAKGISIKDIFNQNSTNDTTTTS